ncbi:hypothetical protein AALB39_25720 [Lachnospiraceae bacterium 54-53]
MQKIEYLINTSNLITAVSFFLEKASDQMEIVKELIKCYENGTNIVNQCTLSKIFIDHSASTEIYLENTEKLATSESCSGEMSETLASLKEELIDLNSEMETLEEHFYPFKTCPLKVNGRAKT